MKLQDGADTPTSLTTECLLVKLAMKVGER